MAAPAPAVAPAAVAEAGDGDPAAAGCGEPPSQVRRLPQPRRKQTLARELAEWIQQQAREHYVPDGMVDEWATLDETLRNNGDDCDGLELLVFNHLRELGFGEDEVYRAIVYRRTDGQHHMVTLWFEQPNDPWVIDPTGAMTTGMPRMSELPEWVPLKVFSHDEDFSAFAPSVWRRSSSEVACSRFSCFGGGGRAEGQRFGRLLASVRAALRGGRGVGSSTSSVAGPSAARTAAAWTRCWLAARA